MIRVVGLLAGVAMVASAQAGLRNYEVPMDQSQWLLEEASPLQCTLSHNIPRYGKAVFVSRASKELNLHFTLQMRRKPEATTAAQLRSVAPAWRPGRPHRDIAQLNYFSHFDGELPNQEAWEMLTELERGMQPTFFYRDWYGDDQVSVGLSAANFGPGYQAFVNCLDELLPYGFEDIAYSVLQYRDKDANLTRASEQRLEEITQYLTLDPQVQLVLESYTDSYGMEDESQRSAASQLDTLREQLIQAGVDPAQIASHSHGEKRFVASNQSASGRQWNRRVVVRMDRLL